MTNPVADVGNFLVSQPYPKPIYKITVDGRDISPDIRARLIDLTLTDNRGFEADLLDIRLDDTDGQLDIPSRGAEVRVWLGFEASGLVDKGTYTVDEIEHSGTPDVLSIRARSADLRGGLTQQRERPWHQVTLGTIIRTIAAENELKPVISVGLASQEIEHIDQTNETAVNLLTRLARQFDAIATVKDGRLLFISAAAGCSVSGKQLPTANITRQSGDQHRFALADRNSYNGVKASYNDIGAGKKIDVIWGKDEDNPEHKVPKKTAPATPIGQYKDVGKEHKSRALALRAAKKAWRAMKANKAAKGAYVGAVARYRDPNLGVSGEASYGQADEDKKRNNAVKQAEKDKNKLHPDTPAPFEHSADNVKVLRHVYASKANAIRAARAEWRRLQRGMATFSITLAVGRPELFPDLPARVSGWKPAIDNTGWIITKATHTLNDNGLGTALEFEIKATEVVDESPAN